MLEGEIINTMDFVKKISKYSDITLVCGIIGILLVLLFPVPTWLLDVLLAFSVSASLVILMATLLINEPLELSIFPSLLLITTIMRLSLNIASTRLILSEGHTGSGAAGNIIKAFGHFVMQGNVVIGIILFLILTLINFIVITKGSGRIAEVAARFSLDAMPGKQMAIDADLSSGVVSDEEAKNRRKKLETETTFYGSMDGANKFVRGDAVAGLIITFINLVGGMIVAVMQKGLTFSEAISTYSILTIGDGLVSQIPSLIVSFSAGLLVTKSDVIGSTDKAIFGQLGNNPRSLMISSGVILLMATIPGLPFTPFFILSLILGGVAYILSIMSKKTQEITEEEKEEQVQQSISDNISNALSLDIIGIELGINLLSLVNDGTGSSKVLTNQIQTLRKQLAKDFGFIIPSIRIRDNIHIDQNHYLIKIKDIEVARGEVYPEKIMLMNPRNGEIDFDGIETREPTFGLMAKWVSEEHRDEALHKEYTVVDASTVIITHLTELIKENVTDLLSYSDIQRLLDGLEESHGKLLKATIPDVLTVSTLHKILKNLLLEMISIKDLPTIIETAADVAKDSRNVVEITEYVRKRISRQISSSYATSDNKIPVISLSPQWEQILMQNLITKENGENQLALPINHLQNFIKSVKNIFNETLSKGIEPVLITTPILRYHAKSLLDRFKPAIPVMSHNELHHKFKITNLGVVKL